MRDEAGTGTVVDVTDEIVERASGDNVRASWPFSLHQLRSNLAHCSEDGREALISAFLWCTDTKHPVHRSEFARRVGYSPNSVYKMLSGKYISPEGDQLDVPEKLVKSIRQFVTLEKERFLGGANEFVMTPTARRIWTACDLARESRTPVFVYGRSHIGKTMALENYTAANNHGSTVYIRIKAASGLGGLIRRAAERLGISPESNTANLTEYIKRAVTSDMLLIFDEVHLLQYTYRRSSFFACLEVIREIHDETNCGMVLSGTKLLLEKIREGERGEMEQLLRRGVHRVTLPDMPTKADIGAILKRWGLAFPDRKDVVSVQGIEESPYSVLRQLAKAQGFLAITERLRYARKIANKRDEALGWEQFIEAHLTIEQQTADTEDW